MAKAIGVEKPRTGINIALGLIAVTFILLCAIMWGVYQANSSDKRDYILAIVFSFPVPIVLYLLLYRGVYRSVIDYKIRKRVGERKKDFINGSDYNRNLITEGEVVETRKWIVGYVKVNYRDENGETQEKWARSWFTIKETKFLEQKKLINIVPYKNTYGILEEMP